MFIFIYVHFFNIYYYLNLTDYIFIFFLFYLN